MKRALFVCLAAAATALHAEICIKNGDGIAFMGDSITQGGNATPAGYVNLVMKGLELCGVQAKKIPAGISGHKSVQMHARLKRDVLDKKPKWMTFSCGVNDVWHGKNGVPLEKYKELVGEIFDACAAAGIEVIVLTATMISENPDAPNNKLLAPYNDWLRAEAKRRGLRLADLNADMQAQLKEIRKTDKTPGNKLTTDGVHMAFPGNCMMAWGVLRAMGVEEAKKDLLFAAFRQQTGAYKTTVSFTADENAQVEAKAKAAGLDKGAYIRKLLGL
jgi:lysophospholipase L1-like esterase